MASFLDFLQQAAMELPAQELPATDDPTGIVVNGTPPATSPDDKPAPNFGNSTYINEADAANENAPEHEGMFHTKGTLRNILGLIGDAFLVQSGNKSVYDVKRQQEKESDALSGFTDDPLAAMERLARRNPAAAQDLYDKYTKNMNDYAQTKSLNDYRKDQSNNRLNDNVAGLQNYAARVIHAAGGDPDKLAYAQNIIAQRARLLGVPLETLGINPNMTPAQQEVYGAGDMTVNQQVQVPFEERKVKASETNAKAHMINATRPRSSGSTHMTDQENYYRINKPGYKKTDADIAWEKKYLHGTKSNLLESLGVDAPPSSTASPSRTQGWKVKRN